jgi:hypothetical protein
VSGVQITAEMVMEVTNVRPGRAARIAAYATHRWAGLRSTDARREVGVAASTGHFYEKFLTALREHHGLPELPTSPFVEGFSLGDSVHGRSGGHQSQHVGRGITSPDCPLCQTETGGRS